MPPVGKLESTHSIQELVRERTSPDLVIGLCEAGRYREAGEQLRNLDPNQFPLLFGMVETARGNQELAKDYLTRAPEHPKKGPQLALAYWRGGELQEARDIIKTLPESFDRFLCEAIFASSPQKAFPLLDQASRCEVVPGQQARLHNERARRLRELGLLDRAIREFDAAIYYFEEAQSDCLPLVINNVARVHSEYGEAVKAHELVDRAIRLLRDDPSHLAKAYDQKALIYLDENKPEDAEMFAGLALDAIEHTDKKAWLVEVLITSARVYLALEQHTQALIYLDRAEAIGIYLNNDEVLINTFTEKKNVAHAICAISDRRQIDVALRNSHGLRDAAKKLHLTSHQQLMRLMKKYKISR